MQINPKKVDSFNRFYTGGPDMILVILDNKKKFTVVPNLIKLKIQTL